MAVRSSQEVVLLHLLAVAHATPGTVTLPLPAWKDLQPEPTVIAPPTLAAPYARSLVGEVDRGLLEATLTTRVQAWSAVDHPILPDGATVGDARLDGAPAPLTRNGGYAVALEAGVHTVQVEVLAGRSTERFERRVQLALPDGGPTRFELVLPEAPIDVTLASGVITTTTQVGGTTRVTGWLDGTGDLDLAWERRATHDATDARMESELSVLIELGGDLVRGRGAYAFEVLAGEADRVELDLPDGVEVTSVEGANVLQWHTTSGTLAVLLKSVVDDRLELDVRFQYPAQVDAPTPLEMPVPRGEMRGSLGVVAPVALDVELAALEHAVVLAPRDVPQSLVDLSTEPLRAAASFTRPPKTAASSSRRGEVLTSASRIEDLQGISLLMEDGTEVGKLKLSVRNADRQVLSVDLPDGARLTHCFRDGLPLKPAADKAVDDRVLVPLTRSARSEKRTYTVRPGDTLSAIADDTYGDASQYGQILVANDLLASSRLQVGQKLVLPTAADETTESFILELGWERTTEAMGAYGTRSVGLPGLDLDVKSATWHVYVPSHLELLTVDGNLTQVSALHTDPITRIFGFLVHSGALGTSAYAGGDTGYRNALKSRRSYYKSEQAQTTFEPLSSYPLVGQRVRFRGNLLGTDVPVATFRFVGEGIAQAVHTVAFWGAFLVALWGGSRPRSRAALATAAVGVTAGAVVGHYLLGTYGQLVRGADLGLFLMVLSAAWTHRRRPGLLEVLVGGLGLFVMLLVLLVKPTLALFLLVPGLWFVLRRLS